MIHNGLLIILQMIWTIARLLSIFVLIPCAQYTKNSLLPYSFYRSVTFTFSISFIITLYSFFQLKWEYRPEIMNNLMNY